MGAAEPGSDRNPRREDHAQPPTCQATRRSITQLRISSHLTHQTGGPPGPRNHAPLRYWPRSPPGNARYRMGRPGPGLPRRTQPDDRHARSTCLTNRAAPVCSWRREVSGSAQSCRSAWPCHPSDAGICTDVMARFRPRILLSRQIGVGGGLTTRRPQRGDIGWSHVRLAWPNLRSVTGRSGEAGASCLSRCESARLLLPSADGATQCAGGDR